MANDTIYALSSGHGISAVAVIRLSGPRAFMILERFSRKKLPVLRQAVCRWLYDPFSQKRLDQGLIIAFKGPQSFTGEDCVEFQLHGSRAVISGFLEALSREEGIRPAEPGEFTRRAFDHGKLDLTEVEGLGDLLQAQTAAQKEQALRQMDGALSKIYEGWRSSLLQLLAYFEAEIDFSDEDLPENILSDSYKKTSQIKTDILQHLSDGKRGEILREGLKIVILGEPNAGKSTLLNHLARSDVAIVSEEAGTTRDILEISLDLFGFPVRLMDTAGIREKAASGVEEEGIRRALKRAEEADLRLILIKAEDWPRIPSSLQGWLGPKSAVLITQIDKIAGQAASGGQSMFHVKHSDQTDQDEQKKEQQEEQKNHWQKEAEKYGLRGIWPISVKEKMGIEDFLAALGKDVSELMSPREAPVLTRERHRLALWKTVEALTRFEAQLLGPHYTISADKGIESGKTEWKDQSTETLSQKINEPYLSDGLDLVLAAEELRLAARALGQITGRVGVEDILDILFSDFCIGK